MSQSTLTNLLHTIVQPSSGCTYLSSITQDIIGQLTGDTLNDGITETYGYDPNRLQVTSQAAALGSNTVLTLN